MANCNSQQGPQDYRVHQSRPQNNRHSRPVLRRTAMTQSTTTKPTTPGTKQANITDTGVKQADNKQADNKVDVANRTAPFDFSALEITDEARPTRRSSRGTDPEQLAKLVDALRKSWEQRDADGYGSGKALMVPTQYSKKVQT